MIPSISFPCSMYTLSPSKREKEWEWVTPILQIHMLETCKFLSLFSSVLFTFSWDTDFYVRTRRFFIELFMKWQIKWYLRNKPKRHSTIGTLWSWKVNSWIFPRLWFLSKQTLTFKVYKYKCKHHPSFWNHMCGVLLMFQGR